MVYLVMALGGFWFVGMIIWGVKTMKGDTPQLKQSGFRRLSLALIGIIIIYEANEIVRWIS